MQDQHRACVCRHCDTVVKLPDLGKKSVRCTRCRASIKIGRRWRMDEVAVVAMSALIFMAMTVMEPIMTLTRMGVKTTISLFSIFHILNSDWTFLLWVFLFVTFVFPGVLLTSILLLNFKKFRPSRIFCYVYDVCHHYGMVDVFVLGIAVSLVKLTGMMEVEFHSGFYCGLAFSFTFIWCSVRCPPSRVWNHMMMSDPVDLLPGTRAIDAGYLVCRTCYYGFYGESGEKCPRCGCVVTAREPKTLQKTSAFLVSALVFFLPANLYPVMYTEYLGVTTGASILEGALILWDMESYFVAVVIILASLCIPGLKIMMLSIMVAEVRFRFYGPVSRRVLSLWYRILEFIGKWSMVDVFVVILMSSAVRMGRVVSVQPGFAIICFCAVVLSTIAAADFFDERVIWDKHRSQDKSCHR